MTRKREIKKFEIVKEGDVDVDFCRVIKLLDTDAGEEVALLDEQLGYIRVIFVNEKKEIEEIGRFEFNEDKGNLITFMNLEGGGGRFLRRGIGTAAIEMIIELYGPVWFRDNDGIPLNDGSHLTENAPPFIASLAEKNLINDPDGIDPYL